MSSRRDPLSTSCGGDWVQTATAERAMTGAAKLDAEIAAYEQRLQTVPRDDPGRPPLLNNLAVRLRARFGMTGEQSDLERAVQACREATASIDLVRPDAAEYLNSLGNCLADRFALHGSADDLDAAIMAYEAAVERGAQHCADVSAFEANLASSLADRYRRDGSADDLDRAIGMAERIWAAGTGDTAEQGGLAANYSSMLQDRYAATGSLEDLESAVHVGKAALARCPPGTVGRTMLLINLGGALQSRYDRTQHHEDLDAALEAFRAGLADTDEGAPDRTLLFNNLGIALSARAHSAAGLSAGRDLTEAIAAHRSAVRMSSRRDRPQRLNNLAAALSERYQVAGRRRDLREALRIWRRVVAETPAHAPSRGRRLGNLARGFALRYDHQGRGHDLVRARTLYRESCTAGLASDPESALAAGLEWGKWAIGRAAYLEASDAYDVAASALDQLFRAQLLRPNKETWLRLASGSAATGSFAHAMAADRPGAVLAIERGRAFLLSETLNRYRIDLTRLAASGRDDLAIRYGHVAQRLKSLLAASQVPR
jgi:tetratricopeptide (TPR) repeat protein